MDNWYIGRMFFKRLRLTACLAVATMAIAPNLAGVDTAAQAAPTWTWNVVPSSDLSGWQGVAYGNGRFVAVASSGTYRVMTTTDPTCTPVSPATSCWTSVDVGTDMSLFDVAYGNGIYVAIGITTSGDRQALTSADGLNWSRQTTPASLAATGPYWWEIEFGGGTFVALATRSNGARSQSVMTSTDGINWTARDTPHFPGCDLTSYGICNQWRGLAWGDNTWIAVSGDKIAGYSVMKSTDDGATWTYITAPEPHNWWDMKFVKDAGSATTGTFIAVAKDSGTNNMMMSTDNGATWTIVTTAVSGNMVASDGSTVMVNLGQSSVGVLSWSALLADLKSTPVPTAPATNWTNNSISGAQASWNSMIYGAGVFLLVGGNSDNRVAYTGSYSPVADTETVTFDPNGGSGSASYQTGKTGATLTLPPAPTRDGYIFAGWNTSKTGGGVTYKDGDTYNFNPTLGQSLTTIYAQWTPVAAPTTTTTSTTVAPTTTAGSSSASGSGSKPTGGAQSVSSLPRTGTNTRNLLALIAMMLVTGFCVVCRRRVSESRVRSWKLRV